MNKIKNLLLLLSLKAFLPFVIYGQKQQAFNNFKFELPKVTTQGHGIILGINQGRYTTFDAGLEKYWTNVKIIRPTTTAVSVLATASLRGTAGITTHVWTRRSRFGPTYGISGGYYTDFKEGSRMAVGPTLGYRLLGAHMNLGYNIRFGDNTVPGVNGFYGSFRYYIPLKRDFSIKPKK